LNIDGILFRLIDTAGIREHAEEIEALGIERSKQKIEQAKIVLCMADVSIDGSLEKVRTWKEDLQNQYPTKRILVIANKTDKKETTLNEGEIAISAKQGINIEQLKAWMVNQLTQGVDMQNETIVTNVRHRDALTRTREALQQAKTGLETNVTGDFVAMD